MEIQSIANEEELVEFGKGFLKVISKNGYDQAVVCALSGELGVGKTTFVQKLAKELGVTESITSPTFIIQKSYSTAGGAFERLIHIDVYRLESASELEKLDFLELLKMPKTLICIEWADKVKDLLPANNTFWLFFEIGENEERKISIKTPSVK